MKILILARSIPSDKYKMQGIFEFDQALALAQKTNNEVVYIAFDLRSIRRWRRWGIRKYTRSGIDVIEVNLPLGQFPDSMIDKIAIKNLRRLLRQVMNDYRIDIIHAHFIENGFYLVKATENESIPTILTEHRSDMNTKCLSDRFKYLGDNTYKNLNQVISVSKTLATSIYKNFHIKSEVIPNIVDLENFRYIECVDRTNNVVSVGNLRREKNFRVLIESFAKAFKDKRKLIIIGEGEEKESLMRQAEMLGISDRVIFKGVLSRNAIAKIMDECSFFALASDSETFGVAYIEALAKGLPVVATKCGGPEDFVNEQNGIMVQCNDSDLFATGLKMLDRDIGSYDRRKISEEITTKFSGVHVAQTLEKLYYKIIEKE
jgi:glycosyltransferase, family 1